jgi:hypothetical protein
MRNQQNNADFTNLLNCCMDLRDALAAAMRVILIYGRAGELFEIELRRIGIPNGIGKRADVIIAAARRKMRAGGKEEG